YRLIEVLGVGGMGTVYLAEDPSHGERVALKVLSPDIAAQGAFRRRFLREAGYARSVEHRSIVRVRDAGESRGLLFIAMEYVDGADLATLLRRERRLDPARAVRLLLQLAEALDTAHAAGLIHRDVKPANCIVAGSPPEERALLTDFGVSRNPATDSMALTVAGDFVGTHFYTAPEQLFGDPDPTADVYSLGCVLYECLTGQPPFPFEDVAAVLEAHVDLPPPSLTELRPDLPDRLAAVIGRSLAKSPGGRFDSCTALMAAAAEALAVAVPGPDHPVSRPTQLTLRVELDLSAGRAEIGVDGGAGGVRLVLEEGRRRLLSE
ncbi:MAG: serine/threonine-protein kinase, partial [Solirubrobacterales bacterium]